MCVPGAGRCVWAAGRRPDPDTRQLFVLRVARPRPHTPAPSPRPPASRSAFCPPPLGRLPSPPAAPPPPGRRRGPAPFPVPWRPHPTPAQPQAQPPSPSPAPTLSPSSGYCYPGALWAHGPLFICHSTSARAWSDGNAPPALLSVRYVAEPSSLTCLSPSALGKPAAASGLLGSPEEGYLFGGSVCARGFKEGAAEGLPALRLSTSKAPRAPGSLLTSPPPAPFSARDAARSTAGRGWRTRRRPEAAARRAAVDA